MFQGDDIEFLEQMHQLQEINKIGEGSFGKIYKALDLTDNSICAVKVIQKHMFKDAEQELEIYQCLQHPHIVTCKRITENKNNYYLVMELMQGGTLASLMNKDKLADHDAALTMKCILQAVNHLHEKRIIHRDLKPENIMLANERLESVKIADFGLSFKVSQQDGSFYNLMNKKCGTIIYMAPEQFTEKYYSNKVDSWSCGIILYMLLSGGKHPFYSKNDKKEQIVHKIINKKINFPNYFSNLAINLIQKLTISNPVERYSIAQALIHPWITRNFDDQIPLTYKQSINQFQSEQKIGQIIQAMFFLEYLKSKSLAEKRRFSSDYIIDSNVQSDRKSDKKSERKYDQKSEQKSEKSVVNPFSQNILTNIQQNYKQKKERRILTPKEDIYSEISNLRRSQYQPNKSCQNLDKFETSQLSFRSSQGHIKQQSKSSMRPSTINQNQQTLPLKRNILVKRNKGLPPLGLKKAPIL